VTASDSSGKSDHDCSCQPAPRTFTVEEANELLRVLRPILSRVVQAAGELADRRERLKKLIADHACCSRPRRDPYLEELLSARALLEEEWSELTKEVISLREKFGVIPRSVTLGIIDFPASRAGQLVYLCWHLDEPAVMFWHPADAGFRGRIPIKNPAEFSVHTTARPLAVLQSRS